MLNRLIFAAPIAALFALSSANSFSADDARWYRVELMVFRQPPASVDENWPPTPELAYPENLQFLIQRDQLPLPKPTMQIDAKLLDGNQTGADGSQEDPNNPVLPTASTANTDTGNPSPQPAIADTQPEHPAEPEELRPTSYALLPRNLMEFRGKAAYMERRGGYKILFHEHWAQLIGPKSESPHLVLPSRVSNAGWPELQGTVQLYLARYLHIETNLWLNTRGEQLPRGWKMPPPPQTPVTPYTVSNEDDEQVTDFQETEFVYDDMGSERDQPPGVDDPNSSLEEMLEAPTIGERLEQFYPYRHAVLMQQKRRMRSIEVHYLDHPLFGIVLKLTPLDDDELVALAEAEPTAE